MRHSKFDAEKAVELILYVAKRADIPDVYHTLKILYFADKAHLAKYGRQMYGDSYIAMSHGPVPSLAYDIVKNVRGDGLLSPADHASHTFAVHDHTLAPFRDADLGMLSPSEVECLDEAISKYGNLTFGRLKRLSHDAAYDAAEQDDIIPLEQIVATLPNADILLEHIKNPHPG